MGSSMVTGRMAEDKKLRGGRILQREGLSASQAINLMYDRIIEDGDAAFLSGPRPSGSADDWASAARFVDALSSKRASRFDDMSKADIRKERLQARGLM